MVTQLSRYASSRDNNFNIIRFIAASLVLFSHSFALVTGIEDAEPLRTSLGMTWGNIAVDVFFITSGFLIAGSFFKKKNVFAFIWARILRIYPALIVATTFTVFVIGLYFTTYSTFDYLSDPRTHQYLIRNSTLFFGVKYNLPGVFKDNPYKYVVNGSLWTLPHEVKMYTYLLIISTGLLFLQNKWNRENILKISILCITVSAFILNVFVYFQLSERIYSIHLFSMFFIGTTYYVFQDEIYLSTKFFALFFIAILLSSINEQAFFLVYSALVSYLVFYLAYIPKGKIRGFNKFGDYSYGIYVYAFPIQQSIAATIPNISILHMIILSFTITFVLAYFSWHLVEKRFLKMKGHYVLIERIIHNKRLPQASQTR